MFRTGTRKAQLVLQDAFCWGGVGRGPAALTVELADLGRFVDADNHMELAPRGLFAWMLTASGRLCQQSLITIK